MRILITGGCGFVGVHTTKHFLQGGHETHVLDDFSRTGTKTNLQWLSQFGKPQIHTVDIRNSKKVATLFQTKGPFDAIIHLAGQTAVTLSVQDPQRDFDINAAGTLHLLEATRAYSPKATFIFSSTNKVYGTLDQHTVVLKGTRYAYGDGSLGISENCALDLHSPYGCSKGAADQYVRDYARIYGLKTIVFRQSCIYGPQQYGMEDQGWIAWFCIAGTFGIPMTIYGDGRQVRDALYIDDLVRAYESALKRADEVKGEIFNIGGGPENTLSLLELVDMLRGLIKNFPKVKFADWRPGDQKVCVMDIGKVRDRLHWNPTVSVSAGVQKLIDWIHKERASIEKTFAVQKAA